MAITVKHLKVSTVPDAGDDTLVEPSDWNADHQLTGTVPVANGGTGAATLTGYVKGNGTANMTAAATIPSTDVTGLGSMATQNSNNISVTGGSISGTTVSGYIPTTEKAQPLGVATLDAAGKVPTSQIPMQGDLNYQGTWNASTNTPTLVSSVGTKGYYYVVDVAGSTNLNGITDWQVGDWAIFNGTVWQKVDNTDAVTSVNGQVGTVVLTTTNIAEGTNEYFTTTRARNSLSAGTGINYSTATGVITNAAPDQTVSITGAGTSVVTGTYPNFTVTSNDAFVGTVTSVAATAGTGISVTGSPITTSGTLNITNTAPDQTVVLTAGTGISTSGTYPNFTITNTSPSLGGDVVGPASATDNAIARFDTTTGKLLQNSVVLVGDTGVVTGVTELTASTKVVSPHFDAQNSAGGQLRNASGTPQLQWGSGGGNNVSVDVAINLNPANSQVDLSPTGTGTVRINPATAGTMNNMVIGGTTPLAITGTTITATSFVGSGASLTNVVNSLTASTGISVSGSTGAVTVTNTAPDQTVALASGTGISVTGTYPNFTVTNTAPSSGGTVTSVTGTAPVVSSGGNTPAISMAAATGSVDGYLTSTDWTTFNSKAPAVTYTTNYIPYGQGTTTPNQNANFTFDGTTQTAPIQRASNGIIVNSQSISASYTIAATDNAVSVGPVTIASGQTVTVSSGSRWVVL